MPDISKLAELAEILDCGLDELLGSQKEADIVKKLETSDGTKAVNMDELADIAPLLPPKKTESILAGLLAELDEMNKMDMETLIKLAPFLSGETLEQLSEKLLRNGAWGALAGLAPFLSEDALGRLAQEAVNGTDKADIGILVGIAPFLSKETLKRLVQEVLNGTDKVDSGILVSLAPFLA